MAEECANSRLYGGIHYNTDNLNGLKMGRSIGDNVNKNSMAGIKPVFVLLSIRNLCYFSLSVRMPVWIGAALFLSLLLSSFSCKHQTKTLSPDLDSKLLATLFCEAKLLRLERFQLADQIRFTEDSLYNFRKTKVLSASPGFHERAYRTSSSKNKEKAEQIKLLQKKLYDSIYISREDRIFLDQEFLKVSKEMCPDK